MNAEYWPSGHPAILPRCPDRCRDLTALAADLPRLRRGAAIAGLGQAPG